MTAQHLYYLFQCFFIYAFLGWCTEVAFAAFKERRFVNRGFLNGPICPVYGFGVVAVIHFLTPLRSNLLLLSRKCYSCYCNRMADRVHSRKGFP